MRIFTTLLFLLAFCTCSAQARLNSMIAQLGHAEFNDVYRVKDSIVNRDKEAMPKLIKLLRDTSYVKLQNTFDLIYPGATRFYGHGGIVNYDIDWISVRAAWILEKMAFQNFGYCEQSISEGQLIQLHQKNYQSYLQNGGHRIDLKNKTPRQKLIAYRQTLADSVSRWWTKNRRSWTRYNALKDALASPDEQRQSLALHFLRFDETRCEGLTLDSYQREIMPLVLKIKNSKSSQVKQAELLLDDKENYWLKIKTKKNRS